MLNILSIALGLLAWGLGIAAVVKRGSASLVFASMAACGAALASQIFEIRRLAEKMDSSSIYDTIGAVAFCATVLLVITAALNLIALLRRRKGKGLGEGF